MITTNALYITSDNLVRYVGLKDAQTGEYVHNATVAMTLKTEAGVDVTGAVDISLTYKSAKTLVAAAAVDNGDQTVKIQCLANGFSVDDYVIIAGTTNYDGTHKITEANENNFSIEATYVAENFDGNETATGGGIYEGYLVDTLDLTAGSYYYLYVTSTWSTSKLTSRAKLKAGYHS